MAYLQVPASGKVLRRVFWPFMFCAQSGEPFAYMTRLPSVCIMKQRSSEWGHPVRVWGCGGVVGRFFL